MRLTSPLNLPAPGRRQCIYGALCGLACTCVFAKQSLGPIICDPPQQLARGQQPQRASLLPKLRDHYAEFLDHVSLVHLRLLASPTCVGLRYGRPQCSPPGFSRVSTPDDLEFGLPLAPRAPLSAFAYRVERPIHKAARPSFHGPPMVRHTTGGAGIFAGFPSSTPLGPRLRVRLTLR